MNSFEFNFLSYQTILLVMYAYNFHISYVNVHSDRFHNRNYRPYTPSLFGSGKAAALARKQQSPSSYLRTSHQERWSEEYIGRGILSQAAAR